MEDEAKKLVDKFLKYGYPFSGGSGFMTGTLDEDGQYNSAIEITLTHIDIVLEDVVEYNTAYWSGLREEVIKLKR
jgi:hypothetical protein